MNMDFLARAGQLAELEKWDALNVLCRDELEGNVDDIYVQYFMALSLQVNEQSQEALRIIEPLFSEGDDFKALYADIMLSLKSFKDSENIYIELSSRYPENDFYLSRLARINLLLLNYQKAYDLSARALKINLENEEAIDIYYWSKQVVSKPEESMLDESLLELNPTNPTLITSHIHILFKKDKKKEAYDLALSSLELFPNNDMVHNVVKEAILNRFRAFSNFEENFEKYFPIIIKTMIRTSWIGYILLKYVMGVDLNLEIVAFILFVWLYVFIILISLVVIHKPIGHVLLYFNDLGKKLLTTRQKISIPPIMAFLALAGMSISISLAVQDLILLRFGVLFTISVIPIFVISDIVDDHYFWYWILFILLFFLAGYAILGEYGLWTFLIFIAMLVFPVIVGGRDFIKIFISIYKLDRP